MGISRMSSRSGSEPSSNLRSKSEISSVERLLTGRIQPPTWLSSISSPAMHRPDIFRELARQWSGQKSGGDSAVSPEFVIAGMIFHPSRVQSELLHKYLEQSFVEVTLLPARHREDVWLLTLRPAQILSAHQIERRQRSVEMKV